MSTFGACQRGLRRVLRRGPAGAHDDRRRGPAARARTSRSTRSSRCPARARGHRGSHRPHGRPPTTSRAPARRSPGWPSARRCCRRSTLSERSGGEVWLKAESLQRTGSFKIRGALNKLAALGDRCARGVTAGSAGNHAWALAQAARVRGVPCEVFMPAEAPLSKAEGCAALGAVVRLGGAGGRGLRGGGPGARPRRRAWPSCTPSTTPTSSPARARSASSCSRTCPTSRRVVVPVGGGGLAGGIAIAVKSARPEVEVVGVQVDTVRRLPRLAAPRRAGRRAQRADDRRRHRREAPGRADARPRAPLARRRRRRRRGRRRRGDGPAAWRRPSSSSRARAPSGSRRCSAAR